MGKAVSLDQLRQDCQEYLQQLLSASQEVEQLLIRMESPIASSVELQLEQGWHRQFSVWNGYAAATRRLVANIHQQRSSDSTIRS